MSISVVIADDQQLLRTAFRIILDAEPDIDVIGEAADGREAIAITRERHPDVVLMDIRMPELDGIEATRQLGADTETLSTRVLILTTFDLDEYVFDALRAGASGFILKDAPADQLVAGIRMTAAGDTLLAPTVTRRLIEEFTSNRPGIRVPADLDALTPRELDVLRLVAKGLSNAEIAAELVIAESTVKSHVARMLTKLGLRDRVQAVVVAYESGLVQLRG